MATPIPDVERFLHADDDASAAGARDRFASGAGAVADEPLAGRRILVAEDEPLLAAAVADALDDLGARVAGPYSSAGQALGAARSGTLDLAYLDLELLHGNAERVAETLEQSGVPFVVVTAHVLDALPAWARRHRLLAKPVTVAAVVGALRAALAAGATADARDRDATGPC